MSPIYYYYLSFNLDAELLKIVLKCLLEANCSGFTSEGYYVSHDYRVNDVNDF